MDKRGQVIIIRSGKTKYSLREVKIDHTKDQDTTNLLHLSLGPPSKHPTFNSFVSYKFNVLQGVSTLLHIIFMTNTLLLLNSSLGQEKYKREIMPLSGTRMGAQKKTREKTL